MADAVIDVVGMDELPLIVDLYNRSFARPRHRWFPPPLSRALQHPADAGRVKDKPVGFFLGFELKPTTFFAWFYGVLPDCRRMGVASQLMDAAHSWARQHEYETIRVECHNSHRQLLHLSIALGYDIVGIRWDRIGATIW